MLEKKELLEVVQGVSEYRDSIERIKVVRDDRNAVIQGMRATLNEAHAMLRRLRSLDA